MQAIIAQLPLSSILALLLGVLPALAGYVAAYVAGYLRSDGFNRYVNAFIAGATIVAFALASIALADAVSGIWTVNLQAVYASVALLAFGQMKPLMLDVQSVVGFTAQGFVLLPPAKPLPVAATQPSLQAMSVPRSSTAVMPTARKVNLVPPVDNNPHAG